VKVLSLLLLKIKDALISVLGMLGVFIVAIALMMALYCLLMIEAVALVMGIDPLIGMMRCMSNCLGDVSISTIVAKQEGVLNLDVYRKL